jgi:hypothetical protein
MLVINQFLFLKIIELPIQMVYTAASALYSFEFRMFKLENPGDQKKYFLHSKL